MSTKGAPPNVTVHFSLSISLLLISGACCSAVEPEPSPTTNNVEPKVTKLYGELAPGKTISVYVTNLFAWSRLSPEDDATKLLPLINGRQLLGLFPTEPTFGLACSDSGSLLRKTIKMRGRIYWVNPRVSGVTRVLPWGFKAKNDSTQFTGSTTRS